MSYEPWFCWFAWHLVDTKDRGWRWLRILWRRKEYQPLGIPYSPSYLWIHRCSLEGEEK